MNKNDNLIPNKELLTYNQLSIRLEDLYWSHSSVASYK